MWNNLLLLYFTVFVLDDRIEVRYGTIEELKVSISIN